MAFAVLRRHGIAAIPGYGFHAALSRMGIAAEVARRRPNGSGWYAFWTATDNRTHLDDEGVLTAPLTVYHHSEVGRQVAAALSDVGLTIGARGIESLVLTAGPARTGRPG